MVRAVKFNIFSVMSVTDALRSPFKTRPAWAIVLGMDRLSITVPVRRSAGADSPLVLNDVINHDPQKCVGRAR